MIPAGSGATAALRRQDGARSGGGNVRWMIVDCAHYRDGRRQHEERCRPRRRLPRRRATDDFVWIGLYEPTDEEMRGRRRRCSTCTSSRSRTPSSAHQRPKIEDYDDSFFIVLKTAHYHDETETVHFGEIDALPRPRLRRHRPPRRRQPRCAAARARLEERPDLLKLGPAAVVWAILDQVVDDYLPVVEGIDDDIEEVEQAVFDDDVATPTAADLLPEARGDRVPPRGLAAAGAARVDRARRDSRRSTRSCAATSATSPTTPGGSTRSSTRSASC